MRSFHLILALVCLIGTSTLTADTVTLKNGDRLTGSIQQLADGKVTLETSYAGTVSISWSEVERVDSEGVLVARLADGEIVEGSLSSPEPGQVQIAGGPALDLDRIALLGQQVEQVDDPGLLEEWHGAANLGYTAARGNTDLSTLSFALTPARETERDRIITGFRVLKSEQDGVTSSNLYLAHFRYERNIYERLFVFGNADFEKDEKELLNLRSGQGGGFGMRFKPADHTGIAVFGGLTFLQEKFENLDRILSSEGNLGFDVTTAWLAPAIFATKTQYLPLLSQDGRYRLAWEGNMTLPLFMNFTFGISLFDNYDSRPPRISVKKNDFGLLTTLGWKF